MAAGPQRIGVLTFHRCINYGSYWQARCLVEAIQAMGHDAVLLDHCSSSGRIAEWRCALRPTLPKVVRSDTEAYACKTRKFLSRIEQLPLSRSFDLDRPTEMESVDTVVIGSDEVWNLRHPWYAQRPAFFGVGLPADRKIAYGGSFGNFSCWEGIGSPWTDYLSQLDAISVRDENSWWMLKNCLGLETDLVVDPCLLNPPPNEGSWQGPSHPFALVYGHSFSDGYIEKVSQWARRHHLPLLSIGYRNDWADMQWLSADPLDFAHAMSSAEAVATNFFHGCVFAVVNGKPFVTETTPYRSIKVRGLMELLESERHLMGEDTTEQRIDDLLCNPIEAGILRRIQEARKVSYSYLRNALSGAHG